MSISIRSHPYRPAGDALSPFDFEAWARLARVDAELFEQQRLAAIEHFIAAAPARQQRRLRGLQFRIDLERRGARTPLAACIRLSAMMWDAFLGRDGLRERLQQLATGRPAPSATAHRAAVIPFPRAERSSRGRSSWTAS